MKFEIPSLCIGGLSCALLLQPAVAETTNEPVTLFKKVVVSASRVEKTDQQQTRSINSIDREALDEIQAHSVADALKFESNVSVSGGPIPGNQTVNIRGLEGNKVLQIIDGTRVNTNFSHRPSYFLDSSLINNINVIKGPVSSLYGTGAIGGVVSQQTISAIDIVKDGRALGGFIKGGYHDNGEVSTTSVALAGKHDQLNWLLAGSYLNSDTMEQGNGQTLFGTKAENSTGLSKVNWQVNAFHELGVNYRYAENDGHPPVVGNAEDESNDPDSLIDRSTKDEHLSLNYHYNPGSDAVNVDSQLYQNKTTIKETNLNAGEDVSEVETLGFSMTNHSSLNKFNLLAGVDGYQDTFNTLRPENGDGRPKPPADAKATMVGAFLYGTYPLLNNVIFEAGIRYDDFKSEALGYADSNDSALSPSLALSWQAKEWVKLSLRYDEAFRAPDVYELFMDGTHFSFYPNGPSNIFVPNPELSPESSKNIEFKSEFQFTEVFSKDKVKIIANLFKNKVEDYIQLKVTVPDPLPDTCFIPNMGAGCAGTSTSENISNADIRGFELGAVYEFGAITASISYSQTRGKDSDTGEYLAGIPADKWVAALDYGVWDIDTKVGMKIISNSDQKHTPSDDTQGPYKGYKTADFYASWEPSSPTLEGVELDLTVANAFDKHYRNAWTSIYEAGRSVKVSAQYNF